MWIVEFNNGKFAVRRGWWIFSSYLDDGRCEGYNDLWWPHIGGFYKRQAMVNSYQKAKDNLDSHLSRLRVRKNAEKIKKLHRV